MTEIVVISGKGGTGKTSVTACLAALCENAALADCDVDAPDLHLLLKPVIEDRQPFTGASLAAVHPDRCDACGDCVTTCRFDAVRMIHRDGTTELCLARIDPLACDGCGACAAFCPTGAITMHPHVTGERYLSRTRFGMFAHARLHMGQGNSGKLVSEVRRVARQFAAHMGHDLLITDGPPGIGCPLIAAIGGAQLALIVAEPTVASLHDLDRVAAVVKHFAVPAAVCINRCDLNERIAGSIEAWAADHDLPVIGRIPLDPAMTEAQMAGRTLIEHAPETPAAKAIRALHADLIERARDRSKTDVRAHADSPATVSPTEPSSTPSPQGD